MIVYVLLHFQEVVGVYASPALATSAFSNGDNHISTLDARGWHIQAVTMNQGCQTKDLDA